LPAGPVWSAEDVERVIALGVREAMKWARKEGFIDESLPPP
jgi:hypothetical protein